MYTSTFSESGDKNFAPGDSPVRFKELFRSLGSAPLLSHIRGTFCPSHPCAMSERLLRKRKCDDEAHSNPETSRKPTPKRSSNHDGPDQGVGASQAST